MIPATSISTASSAAKTSNAAGGTSGKQAGTTPSANFDTFLKMLTTQLKNQDPLNPMEGSDFAVQLATFSGVEQQAQTNKLLEQMVTQSGGGSLGQLADWIGKEVRTTEPVWFGDKPLTLDVSPPATADNVTLIVLNQNGSVVTREEIGPGQGQIDWLGRDDLGDKLPDGHYFFKIESSRKGEVISTDPVGAYITVTEAQIGTEGTVLMFKGGGSAPASMINAIRDPA